MLRHLSCSIKNQFCPVPLFFQRLGTPCNVTITQIPIGILLAKAIKENKKKKVLKTANKLIPRLLMASDLNIREAVKR